MNPLVSLVMGTWRRPQLVLEAIENARAQTYRPLELVIVSDGPDDELAAAMYDEINRPGTDLAIRYVELGYHASSLFTYSISAAPFAVAQFLATGPLQMWLSDDERMTPDHVESLVALLTERDVDFVYSLAECYYAETPEQRFTVGQYPPAHGAIVNALYRRELLDYGMFELHTGSGTDWAQVRRWREVGASCALLTRVTFSHRIDKIGEGPDVRLEGQPLRGMDGKGSHLGPRWNGHPIGLDGKLVMRERR